MPVLLGITALAVSAGGAISAADPSLIAETAPRVSPASALSGSGDVSTFSLEGRGEVVSRGFERGGHQKSQDHQDHLRASAERQIPARNAALARLARQAEAQSTELALNQWYLPVDSVALTATYGEYGLWASYHTGLDFNGNEGDPIYAVASGVVTSAGYDGAYGNKTVITLEDGTEIWYCHQSSYLVSEGDMVRGGEQIGSIGSTGNVTGSHLHLEVRPGAGDPVDPYAAFQVHGLFG